MPQIIRRLLPSNQLFTQVIYAFSLSMGAYLAGFVNFDRSMDRLEEMGLWNSNNEEFDFIVVGSGSAGAIVANRLSEKYSVLLLEAGGEPYPLNSVPYLATTLINHPSVDWAHLTVPQKNSTFAQNNCQSLLSQGKSLGGTSNINYLMHTRGNPRDFDAWSKLVDDEQWNYENLLPFFKKNENYIRKTSGSVEYSDLQDDVHGYDGEMTIQVPPSYPLADEFLQAVNELGYKRVDVNGRYTEGFDYTYCPIKSGRRQGTFAVFIEPARNRKLLTIRKFAHVTKVLFQNDNEAYGVNYDHHGRHRTAYATREVILSAGMNSPKILLHSGIGPKQELQELGIPVKQDLPMVGKQLQDHLSAYLGPFFIDKPKTINVDRDLTPLACSQYIAAGTGPLSSTAASAFGFFSSEIAKSAGEGDWPDVQLILVAVAVCKECDRLIAKGFNIREDILSEYYKNAKGKDSFLILVSNARPKARGEMKIGSADPYEPAIIDPKYLDNEHDMKVTIAGMKKAIQIVENTTAFQDMGGRFTDAVFPGCEDVEFRSDAYFECYARMYSVSLHHIVGTCSMAKSKEFGVVDSNLNVFGTKRLRVVDASVMPLITVGNTNSQTILLGEKGSHTILSYWEKSENRNSIRGS